jgi:hypothetical protein
MNVALFKALVALWPASLLLSGSAILFLRQRSLYPFMQLLGAGCIVAVVLTHVCEALHWVPGMHWGLKPQRWSLCRFSRCRSRFHAISGGILALPEANTLERLLALGAEPAGQGNGQPDCNFWLTAHTQLSLWRCRLPSRKPAKLEMNQCSDVTSRSRG